MKIVVYRTEPHDTEHYTWWRDANVALGHELAKQSESELAFGLLPIGGGRFKIETTEDIDIAFLPCSWYPDKRPAKWIYTFFSDIRNYENKIMQWIDAVKPNFIGCLQDLPEWLVAFCEQRGVVVQLMPWFMFKKQTHNPNKRFLAMCTGAIGKTYPRRTEIHQYLYELSNKPKYQGRLILSCGNFGHYNLSTKMYRLRLWQSKYYITGGIHDEFIPPKYYEAMSYGTCLVSFGMPHMEECGFVDGKTYIKLKDVREIDDIINSDRYKVIGKQGKRMVEKDHSAEKRAGQILGLYYEFTK